MLVQEILEHQLDPSIVLTQGVNTPPHCPSAAHSTLEDDRAWPPHSRPTSASPAPGYDRQPFLSNRRYTLCLKAEYFTCDTLTIPQQPKFRMIMPLASGLRAFLSSTLLVYLSSALDGWLHYSTVREYPLHERLHTMLVL